MANKLQQGSVKCLWDTLTVDFASTPANTSTDSSGATITGARLGDPVLIGSDTTWLANISYVGFVSAADTVKVRLNNGTIGALDPASQVFTLAVLKLQDYT